MVEALPSVDDFRGDVKVQLDAVELAPGQSDNGTNKKMDAE